MKKKRYNRKIKKTKNRSNKKETLKIEDNDIRIRNNNKIIQTIKSKYFLSTTIIILLFIVMLFVFYQNITLKLKRNKLNDYLEEYQSLKEEIDYLKEINENYEIILKNNEELENEKKDLENKINELNDQINNLNTKIDKLK